MVAFLWLMFNIRLITAIIDCGYVGSPTVTINGDKIPEYDSPIPLNVCSSVNEYAFKLSCDKGEVIIHAWNGKECDGDEIIGDNSVESKEFNCDSQHECDYLYFQTVFYSANCGPQSTVTSSQTTAFVTDKCYTTRAGSVLYTSYDLSGSAQLFYITTTDCTGTVNTRTEFPSDGDCVDLTDGNVVWLQAICPDTNNPTNNPTNTPTTNTPTTNTPTTNTPTTNTPTTNNPTNNPTSHPTTDPLESESIESVSGSVESADYGHNDFIRYVYDNDNENDVEIEFGNNTLFNIWILCGICIAIFIIINCKFGVISF